MNQYELGKHQPEFSVVERLAKVLNVPEAYFYAKNDDTAELLILLHRTTKAKRDTIMKMARETL